MSCSVLDRLDSIGSLPTPPEVVLRLLELTGQEDVSVGEVAETLAHDSVLAAKIMRFVNSPLAGITCKITSLQRAVSMLGLSGVKMMALSFAVLPARGAEACRGFDSRQFGLQSVGCGVAARVLSSSEKDTSVQEPFVAGLLSQIGRAVLAIGLPEEYANVLDAAQQVPRDLPLLEQTAFGETYAEIGAQLLRSWHIPEELCGAIEKFRRAEDGAEQAALTKVLYVSEIAAGILCPDVKAELPDPRAFVHAASQLLGIQRERCADLMNEIATGIESTRILLELPEGKLRSPVDIEREVRERVAELTLVISLENQKMAEQQEVR